MWETWTGQKFNKKCISYVRPFLFSHVKNERSYFFRISVFSLEVENDFFLLIRNTINWMGGRGQY